MSDQVVDPAEAPIPNEIRAQVVAGMFFDAVREGDYPRAASMQQYLRELGWHVVRVAEESARSERERRKRRKPDDLPAPSSEGRTPLPGQRSLTYGPEPEPAP
jgi:hypothetical protein